MKHGVTNAQLNLTNVPILTTNDAFCYINDTSKSKGQIKHKFLNCKHESPVFAVSKYNLDHTS